MFLALDFERINFSSSASGSSGGLVGAGVVFFDPVGGSVRVLSGVVSLYAVRRLSDGANLMRLLSSRKPKCFDPERAVCFFSDRAGLRGQRVSTNLANVTMLGNRDRRTVG